MIVKQDEWPLIGFPETELLELLDFRDYPILYVDRDVSFHKYISYLNNYVDDQTEHRLITEVSEGRLSAIRQGDISIKQAYDDRETLPVYLQIVDSSSGNAVETYLIPCSYFRNNNPVPEDYRIHCEFLEDVEVNTTRIIDQAVQRNKVILDFNLTSPELASRIRPWAFYNVLLPAVDIIKTSLRVDKKRLNSILAFTDLKVASFHANIEVDYTPGFLDYPYEYGALCRLIDAVKARDMDQLSNAISGVESSAELLKNYEKILNAVVKHKAILGLHLADPIERKVTSSSIDSVSAANMIGRLPREEPNIQTEWKIGTFLDIITSYRNPAFTVSLKGLLGEIKGKFHEDVLAKLINDRISVSHEIYRFLIETTTYPSKIGEEISPTHRMLDYLAISPSNTPSLFSNDI